MIMLQLYSGMREENKNLYSYLTFFFSSLSVVLLTWYLLPYTGKTTIYLLSILIVAINAWFVGYNLALWYTFVSVAVFLYFFLVPNALHIVNPLLSLYEITVFAIVSVVILHVIEKYRMTDLRNDFSKKDFEYRRQINALQQENTKMQQEIKLREEFLSIASHELKTPLTSMLLKLQMVLHNIRNVSLANFSVENLLKMLETAEQQTQRLARLINDLLNVSLITTGKWNLELGKTDVVTIVREVLDEFSEKMEKRHIDLKVETDQSLIASVDKLRFEQMLTNLLSNAIKYGNGKPIEIKLHKKNDCLQLIVKDYGIGIDSSKKDHIFGLFQRGVRASDYKGLGVGLYIASQIVSAHNGSIQVSSRLNSGSTFTIELPIEAKH